MILKSPPGTVVDAGFDSETEGITAVAEEEAAREDAATVEEAAVEDAGTLEEPAALEELAATDEAAPVEEAILLALEKAFEDAIELMKLLEGIRAVPLVLPVADVRNSDKLVLAAEVAGADEVTATEEEAVCTRDPDADPEATSVGMLEEAVLSGLDPTRLELLDWLDELLDSPFAELDVGAADWDAVATSEDD
ncbi:hypothetical protein PG997_003410 [Apiospora hydei]|uniref:Uncharacterized protein n=1 Tax=Apiospora hydei TaxID=1337664 RepID=A0ABR1WZ56_9PEZI